MKQLKADVESKNRDIDRLNVAKNKIQANVSQLENSLSEARLMNEGLEKRLETVNATVGDLQVQIDTQASTISTLEQENEKKASEIISKVIKMLSFSYYVINRIQIRSFNSLYVFLLQLSLFLPGRGSCQDEIRCWANWKRA